MGIFRVEKNKNYTVMSNYHLKDRNLSLKSKGLLSVILSLPDEWNYTTRGLASICKEGVDCISASLRELETVGYLERNQLRDNRGRITDTEYIIYEFPYENPEKAPYMDKPYMPSPCTENPYMDESDTENTAQYNTNIQNTKKVNTHVVNNHQSITHGRIDEIDSYNNYREIIHENIDYEILCERHDRKTLDEIVNTMLDYICGKRDSVKIGGAEYPHEIVKSRLLKLDSSHIEYVCNCISKNVTKVRNIRAYMLATLYNAPTTIDHYYSTLVSHDMANMRS
jgi:hypothetical protein